MSKLSPAMQAALEQLKSGNTLDGVRSTTIRALERRSLVQQTDVGYVLTDSGSSVVAETLSAHRPNKLVMRWHDAYTLTPTHDPGQSDYAFWDKARKGKVKGLEISGMFLKPLGSKKAGWVLGMPPVFKIDHQPTLEALTDWWTKHHPSILRAYNESVDLGDSYFVVNPPDEKGDLKPTIIPPHVIEPKVDDKDYSKHTGWEITEVHAHPTRMADTMTIVDEYTKTQRLRTVKKQGVTISRQRYRNLLEMLPLVHIPNNIGADEKFGHPDGEGLLGALHYYGKIFEAALEGNWRQGRPTPTFQKMGSADNVEAFIAKFGRTEIKTLPDGTTETYIVLDFDPDEAVILGDTGEFKYSQPGSFTGDTSNLLGLLFYLIIQHTEHPEFLWGNAVQGSRASVETQLPPFIKWVEMQQGRIQEWILQIARIVLKYLSLTEPGVRADVEIGIKWRPLSDEDGRLTLDAIRLGMEQNLLDRNTALSLMPLDVENPAEVLKKVDEEIEERQQRFMERQEDLLTRMEDRDENEDEPDEETEDTDDDDESVDEIIKQAERILSEQHTGVMVALPIPPMVASKLWEKCVDAGIRHISDPDTMHITLAYLGDTTDMDDEDRERLSWAVTEFAREADPLEGVVSGVGRFNNDDGSGVNALYASVDAPDLPEFRQKLVSHLMTRGFEVAKNHGFTPHITLAYMPVDKPAPPMTLPETRLQFDRIVFAWGGDWQVIKLGEREPEAMPV